MKRKLFAGMLAATLAAGAVSVPTAAAARSVPVQVDGSLLPVQGHLENGVTYIPLRSLLDAFGGWELRWDAATRSAIANGGSGHLTADPESNTVTLNGHTYAGSVYVLEGRTYVPLRITAAACGADVVWDGYLGGAAVTSPGAQYDAVDLYWLSRIISAESQSEPMEGQIAVGNVVLNRVASEEFPNSIPEVIFDRKDAIQFEPVGNGTVYHTPTAQSVEASLRVLAGEQAVNGCLYFYAPALSQGLWINANRTYATTIGCHRFYL